MPISADVRRKVVIGSICGGLVVAVVWVCGRLPSRAWDDSLILLVYVRHLRDAGGWYWNASDGPADGATSALDLWLKSGLAILSGTDDLVSLNAFVTAATLAVAGIVAFFLIYRLDQEKWVWAALVASISAWGVLFDEAVVDGASFLLETPLLLICGVSLLRPVHSLSGSSVAFRAVCMSLVRPEGVVLAGLYLCHAAASASRSWKAMTKIVAAVTATLAAYYLWRWIYFGRLFPLPYYAKRSVTAGEEIADGLSYVLAALIGGQGGMLLFASGLCAVCCCRVDIWKSSEVRVGAAWALLASALAVMVTIAAGGDSYSGQRFLALPVVFSVLALAHCCLGLRQFWRRFALVTLVSLVVIRSDVVSQGRSGVPILELSERSFECDKKASELIAAVPGVRVVAESDFQRVKYFRDSLVVRDLHGLNSARYADVPAAGPVRWGKYRPENGVDAAADVWIYGFRQWSDQPLASVDLRKLSEPSLRLGGYGTVNEIPSPRTAADIARLYLPASVSLCGEYFNVLILQRLRSGFLDAGFEVGRTWAD